MTTEWIEHHGKGYPDLPLDTLVQVRFADSNETDEPHWTVDEWEINWRLDPSLPCDADITHYRVVAK